MNYTIGNYTFDTAPADLSASLRQIEPASARDGREYIPKHPEMFIQADWGLDVKLDGERLLAHFEDIIRFTTRRVSKRTNLFSEKTNNVPHLRDAWKLAPLYIGTVLDGEVIMHSESIKTGKNETSGTLASTTAIMNSYSERAIMLQEQSGWISYHVFDCLFYKGEDVRSKTLVQRKAMAKKVCDAINAAAGYELYSYVETLRFVGPESPAQKKKFIQDIIESGGEGAIFKHFNAAYGATNSWVKAKKETSYDVIITGFEMGKAEGKYSSMIGTFVCSAYDGDKLVEVCKCVPGDDELRKRATEHFEEFEGKVIEVAGQEVTGKNIRIRHPRIVKWRPDRNPESCKYSQFTDKGED